MKELSKLIAKKMQLIDDYNSVPKSDTNIVARQQNIQWEIDKIKQEINKIKYLKSGGKDFTEYHNPAIDDLIVRYDSMEKDRQEYNELQIKIQQAKLGLQKDMGSTMKLIDLANLNKRSETLKSKKYVIDGIELMQQQSYIRQQIKDIRNLEAENFKKSFIPKLMTDDDKTNILNEAIQYKQRLDIQSIYGDILSDIE